MMAVDEGVSVAKRPTKAAERVRPEIPVGSKELTPRRTLRGGCRGRNHPTGSAQGAVECSLEMRRQEERAAQGSPDSAGRKATAF